jgi:type VI secretion system secreted protein VgrG
MPLSPEFATAAGLAPSDAIYQLAAGEFGPAEILVALFKGREEMNGLYWFDVHFRFLPSNDGDLEDVLPGASARLSIDHGGGVRTIEGVVTAAESQGVHIQGGATGKLRLMPRVARLCWARSSRIFQGKTVVDIVDAVLGLHNVRREWNLAKSYPVRAYCVQYHEYDYDFVTRLLAEEGIMFFFQQPSAAATDALPDAFASDESVETLVLVDDPSGYRDIAGVPALAYRGSSAMQDTESSVSAFSFRRKLGPESVMVRDYDYRRPLVDLRWSSLDGDTGFGVGTYGARVYEHHSEYESPDLGRNVTPTRLQQYRARLARGEGVSSCRRLTPGHIFSLEYHDQAHLNARYVTTRVEHEGYSRWVSHEGIPDYCATFRCTTADIAFRPPRPEHAPRQVVETAVVVGPGGEEIHTDELGRIKVQFHWDLAGAKNEYSSCFLRVVQPWAGPGWGSQFIPRVGMEVLVSFIGGDLDNPVVVGALYNAVNPPTYPLPAARSWSGIRTRSTPGGNGYNELAFNDETGNEEVFVRAQKNLRELVQGERVADLRGGDTVRVAGSESVTIGGNQSTIVAGGQLERVEQNQTIIVGGDRLDTVSGKADVTIGKDLTTVVRGDDRRNVDGNAELSVEGDSTTRIEGDLTTMVVGEEPRASVFHVEGTSRFFSSGMTEVSSDKQVILRCGKSSIRLTPDAIELVAPEVRIKAPGASIKVAEDQIEAKARKTAAVKAETVLLRSSGARILLGKEVKIDGEAIKLNCTPKEGDDQFPEPNVEPTKIAITDKKGRPLPYQRYVVLVGDEETVGGIVDKEGKDEIVLEEGDAIVFPDLGDVKMGGGSGGPTGIPSD